MPVDDVYWFNASKQTKRISANVSGLGGTARIALNDNLLHGTSLPEIRAVMGHEMGHYRLYHGIKLAIGLALALGVGYFVVNYAFGRFQRRYGERWGVRDLADPAGLPLGFAIFVGGDVPADAGDELAGPDGRGPGGRLRPRLGPGAARLRLGRHAAQHVSQARAGLAGRSDLLRSPERTCAR